VSQWQSLTDALIDEDRRLRRRIAACPHALREGRGPDGTLSCKETLGHIAFWDDYAVRHFTARLDPTVPRPAGPPDFEALSRAAIARAERRTFGDVLARYLEVTGALVAFIANNWERLEPGERAGLWVPLEHRQHHRLALEKAIDALAAEDGAGLAAGA